MKRTAELSEKQQADGDNIDILEVIDELCADFRRQWKRGTRPRIEAYLGKVPENAMKSLFRNLLQAEIRSRRQSDESPNSDEYVNRFPAFKRIIRQAFDEPTMMSIDQHGAAEDANAAGHTATIDMPAAKRIGDYELVGELGRGGFGVVYEARHLERGNRVALKTLPTGIDGQEINADRLHRFRTEFRSLAEFNHPNLVGMQTLEVDGSQWFFTMDLIDGEDFLSYVRPDDKLDEDRLRDSLGQLVTGIVALHQRRILHRDLKPSNVQVGRDGRVTILDFGLVAELRERSDQTASMQTRNFAGTPRYAAPEQVFGQRFPATDWYAMGTMLYEALVGEPPYRGTQAELLVRKQNEDPPQLADREDLPRDLAQLTDSLLARDPNDRPDTDAIADALQLNLQTTARGTTDSQTSQADSEEIKVDDSEVVLIGREKQLAELEQARQDVLESQKPLLVWIRGKSGEGKSSLCEAFMRPFHKGREMLVLSGRCYDRESVPFKAVDSIIESLVRYLRSSVGNWLQSDQPEDVEFLAQVFPLLRRVEWIADRKIHDLEHTEPQKIRGRAFYGLRQLLTAISRRTTIVIHIDDLQWGDADSARAWHELLNHTDAPPLLVLGSYRSDETDESLFLEAWGRLKASAFHRLESRTVSVQPLTQDECLELAAQRTGLPRETIQDQIGQLFHDTDGNPYFLDQLLEGFDPDSGSFRHVPLDELVAGRLSRLPSAASRLLEVIAISGKPIRIKEAASVAGAEQSAMGTLTHMRNERLVRLLDAGDEPMVETWHDKVRESVLDSLPKERRKALHLQLAEEIERKQDKLADDWLESLRKLSTPGEYEFPPSDRLLDLGQHFSDAQDRRAFVYQWLAGEQAMRAYVVEEGHDLFQRARSSLPTEEVSNLPYRFWMGLARVSLWRKSPDQATEAYKKAVEKASDRFDAAEAYAGLEAVNIQLGRFDQALQWMELAMAQLEIRLPKSSAGRLISFAEKNIRVSVIPAAWQAAKTSQQSRKARLAQEILLAIQLGIAEKSVSKTIDFTTQGVLHGLKTGEQPKIAVGLAVLANMWSVFGVGWVGQWYLRLARQVEATVGDPELAGTFLFFSGVAHYWLGNLQAAEPLIEQSYSPLTRCCQFQGLQHSIHMHRHILAYIGDSRSELETAYAVLELATTTGSVQGHCWGSYDVAGALARAGELSEAPRYMQQANHALPDERFFQTSPIRASTDAYFRLQCSDYSAGRRLAESAWAVIREGWCTIDCSLLCVPILVESIAGPDWLDPLPSHDRRAMKGSLRRATFFYRMIPNHQAHIDRVRGRAYWRLGKQRKATRYFEKAMRAAEKKGMKYQQAKSLLDLAAVHETDRERNRAEAIRLLIKMKSVIPRAESWLLGDQYDEAVVAPEFDLEAWEEEHGPISPAMDAGDG